MRIPTRVASAGLLAVIVLAAARSGQAHKPITSPYTFSEHVLPILRTRCGACHTGTGVAPMSLLTYDEAVPWGESMRLELVAGHMPPWHVENASRFRNASTLTPRELNVLLTWAAGGTPPGDTAQPAPPVGAPGGWALGTPDVVLTPSGVVTLPADVQERTEQLILDPETTSARWIRAIDLMPSAPSAVRSAIVTVSGPDAAPSPAAAPGETLLALWLPGDPPIPLEAGTAFSLPAGARLVVRLHYRKTWRNEREVVSDRTRLGLYFAAAPRRDVRAIALRPPASALAASGKKTLSFARLLDKDVRVLAAYPTPPSGNARIAVHATAPDGTRTELIAFHAQRDWARRYWYRSPVSLRRGTRIDVSATPDDPTLLPPGATAPTPVDRRDLGVVLNVVED
jgi:hypothetical protein